MGEQNLAFTHWEYRTTHTWRRTQSPIFNGRDFYFYSALIPHDPKSTHSIEVEMRALHFGEFPVTEILHTRLSSLPVTRMYWNTTVVILYRPEDNKALAASGKTSGQSIFRAQKSHLGVKKEVVTTARAAENSPPLSTPKNIC